MVPQTQGIAFNLDADAFITFGRSLPGAIRDPSGQPLELHHIVDFDLCWAFNLTDPWGNHYELNCYEYERIRRELVEARNVEPQRYWPRGD
ncbi:hypothetical protein [Rhizobacter sp. Root404]|uniref:hypothetical protein n=1 Tax=Rhizobacter sp. Root404 TaxID=1736528 RepID=UPI0006FB4664|nr:hypothetical protein [Rhizobacter sp. Root404]KQW39935.1 hypothetical protein ASC76_00255 [Rhizobacter sp. Root404]